MHTAHLGAVVVFASLFSVGSAAAQTPPARTPLAPAGSVAIVITDAPIMLLPDATRVPLRVAAKGTNLVVDRDGPEWVQVTFNDPQLGLRQGYIQAKYVTIENRLVPTDLSVPGATAPIRSQQASTRAQEQRPLPAQPVQTPGRQPLEREGFWFSLGMGLGSACNDGCLRGLSGGLSLGATLNPHVLLGVGTTGYYRELYGVTATAGTLDARVRLYPWLSSGAFFTGGIGLGTVSVADEREFGVGFMPGFGWDIRVGKKVSLTPYYDWFLIRGNGLSANVEQLGLAFTIH